MASPTVAERLWPYIRRSVDRIVTALSDLEAAGLPLDWRPDAADSNSVYVLAVHALGNIGEQLLGVLCGLEVERDRDAEFAATSGHAEVIVARWSSLAQRVEAQLRTVPDAALAQPRTHPRRGEITGLEVLILVARHMAEHAGQAELTRDLAIAHAAR